MTQSIRQIELTFSNAHSAYQNIVDRIREAHENSETIDQLERDLVPQLMNLGRAGLEDFITAAGDGDCGLELTAQEQIVKRSEKKHRRVYRSVFGNLDIERYVYSSRAKTKALVKPLDQKLGLPADEVSYVLEDWLGNLSVDMPFATATKWLKKTLGIEAKTSMAHRRAGKLGCLLYTSPSPRDRG